MQKFCSRLCVPPWAVSPSRRGSRLLISAAKVSASPGPAFLGEGAG